MAGELVRRAVLDGISWHWGDGGMTWPWQTRYSNVDKAIINHPPVITIFTGGILFAPFPVMGGKPGKHDIVKGHKNRCDWINKKVFSHPMGPWIIRKNPNRFRIHHGLIPWVFKVIFFKGYPNIWEKMMSILHWPVVPKIRSIRSRLAAMNISWRLNHPWLVKPQIFGETCHPRSYWAPWWLRAISRIVIGRKPWSVLMSPWEPAIWAGDLKTGNMGASDDKGVPQMTNWLLFFFQVNWAHSHWFWYVRWHIHDFFFYVYIVVLHLCFLPPVFVVRFNQDIQ